MLRSLREIPMKRSAIRAALLGLALLAASPLTWVLAGSEAVAADSGGIGLTRPAWEAVHGSGNPGQTLVAYENGTYAVGFQDDVVTFIEVSWPGPGLQMDAAESSVRDLLPGDARLDETFFAPATAGGARWTAAATGPRSATTACARTGRELAGTGPAGLTLPRRNRLDAGRRLVA